MEIQLDHIDKKILSILSVNSKMCNKEIAAGIGLSVTPTFERIKRLERHGVIKGYTAVLDKKMIAFYTIYEKFDQIGIFENNFEKELLKSLEKINENIISVVDSINRLEFNLRIGLIEMGMSITSQIANTSDSIDKRLSSIGSDLKFNNLLTVINTYQLSK